MTSLVQKIDDLRVINDVIILAEAEREDFCDVEVVTLTAYKRELATDLVFEQTSRLSSMSRRVEETIPHIRATEFVEVLPTKIRVVLDADLVDGHTVNRAMSLLMKISEFPVGLWKSVTDIEREALS